MVVLRLYDRTSMIHGLSGENKAASAHKQTIPLYALTAANKQMITTQFADQMYVQFIGLTCISTRFRVLAAYPSDSVADRKWRHESKSRLRQLGKLRIFNCGTDYRWLNELFPMAISSGCIVVVALL